MKKIWHWCTVALLLSSPQLSGQAAFTVMGTPYTQDFNTLPNTVDGSSAAWVQNATRVGWYIDEGNSGATCGGTACDDLPTIEATPLTMNNGGNAYLYASGSDRSIGSRAAGSTGTIYYGVRITNSTGSPITSIYIDYYGEQWTIAKNGANVNTIALEYQVGATVTSLTAGAWTATGLNFTQIYGSAQSAGMGGSACAGTSAQCLTLNGNLSPNRSRVQGCVTVAIPAGQEIMLRWVDMNDGANDHHMQIDDLSIYPFNIACAIILPVELLSFTAERNGNTSLLNWETASEENNDYFNIERLNAIGEFENIGRVDGNGSTSMHSYYTFTDEAPLTGVNYYRLKQFDFNGHFSYSEIRAVTFEEESNFSATAFYANLQLSYTLTGTEGETNISVYATDGKLVSETHSESPQGQLPLPSATGVYCIVFTNAKGNATQKVVILLEQ